MLISEDDSYTVKIRSNTKSSYHIESFISTWLILVQIEPYRALGKGFTGQKWRKMLDILSIIKALVLDEISRTYRVRLHCYL